MSNRKFLCAGCQNLFPLDSTTFYRNKRWCGDNQCQSVIDKKVKHLNYKKIQKKIKNGTYRNGVSPEIREQIKIRDNMTCRMCHEVYDSNNLQVHHIVPVSHGGQDCNSNLVLLCCECHKDIHRSGWENYEDMFKQYTQMNNNEKV